MEWLEFSVSTGPDAVDAVSDVLTRYGHGGVVIENAYQFGPDEEATRDASAPVIVRTYLPADHTLTERREALEQAVWHLGQIQLVEVLPARSVREEDWATAWKEHYHVTRIGRRIVIRPSWREYEPFPHDLVLTLDPGMAFGTGLHPTTKLCLEELEERVKPGMRVLDVGTGSGILAIAAARLGAAHVDALDTDSVAVAAARENVAANGLSERVSVASGSLDGRPVGPYDLVVANIIARVIAALAPHLYAALKPGCLLLASGIINTREDEVRQALEAAGFADLERPFDSAQGRRQEADWVLLAARRPEA